MSHGSFRQMQPGQSTVTITRSRQSWTLEFGRERWALTRVREACTVATSSPLETSLPIVPPKKLWSLAAGAFASVSAFGLIAFGAAASEPSLRSGEKRYLVSVPLPSRAERHTRQAAVSPNEKRTALILNSAPLAPKSKLPIEIVTIADEVYFDNAMRTGEMQEWIGSDGNHRFLTVGPEQVIEGQRCRALATLIRRTEGANEVRQSQRCLDHPAVSGLTDDKDDETASSAEMQKPGLDPADQGSIG